MSPLYYLRLAGAGFLPMALLAWGDPGIGPKVGSELDRDESDPLDPLRPEVSIVPSFVRLVLGESFLLKASVEDLFREIPENIPYTWASTDPLVAGVDSEGRVWANGPGRAVITLRFWEHEATAMIDVETP